MAITSYIFLGVNVFLSSMLFPDICNLDPLREPRNAYESCNVIIELDGGLLEASNYYA